MLFNIVVNEALKDRSELSKSFGGKLVADIDRNIVWLIIHPRNSLFTESAIGFYSYGMHKGVVDRTWVNGL
jgi:hypothetical protein